MSQKRDKAIKLLLNFMYIDLSRLDEHDLMKVGVDLQYHLFRGDNNIYNPYSSGGRLSLEKIQRCLLSFFSKEIEPLLNGEKKQSSNIPYTVNNSVDRFFHVQGGELHFSEIGTFDWEAESLKNFYLLLGYGDPLPVSAFQRCSECDHWFYNRREKRFCTNKCNWKFNSRMKRGEPGSMEREKYNDQLREIMKKKTNKAKSKKD